jgi:Xaa-Pro aminopeptidase
MKRLLALTLIALALASTVAIGEVPSGSITVKVHDACLKHPRPGVWIFIDGGSQARARTDQNGQAFISGLGYGIHEVKVCKVGPWICSKKNINLRPGRTLIVPFKI